MDVVFSIKVTSMENEHLHTAIEAIDYFNESKGPGLAWVEMFPLLRYIPAWLPGGIAQSCGARARPALQRLRNKPYNMVKNSKVYPFALRMSDTISYCFLLEVPK